MLKADYHRHFKKDYRRLPQKIRKQFAVRLEAFLKNPSNPLLNDHPLSGDLFGKRAFSVTGNVRVIYRYLTKDMILLLRVGTHNQVYY